MPFQNREDAGRQLGNRIQEEAIGDFTLIALPRGGVPVAREISEALDIPLNILVVRKVGAPSNPEYGIGAVTEGGLSWIDEEAARGVDATAEELEETLTREAAEVKRRARLYRSGRDLPDLRGKTVLIVDDGLATGVTARVACRFVRHQGAARVIIAAPVCAPTTAMALHEEADQVICLETPASFFSVGQFYDEFDQVTDEEVLALLKEVVIQSEGLRLPGFLSVPEKARGIVIFAHGSGSSRLSPRNLEVAQELNRQGLGTLLFDLLTEDESLDRNRVFDIPLLATRLLLATHWIARRHSLPIGFFGASTGGGAALWAAADSDIPIAAIVSRGGRPDLAIPRLSEVEVPTLLLVGGQDDVVIELNREALRFLRKGKLTIVPGATHLFEEPGALGKVAEEAASWFRDHFAKSTGIRSELRSPSPVGPDRSASGGTRGRRAS